MSKMETIFRTIIVMMTFYLVSTQSTDSSTTSSMTAGPTTPSPSRSPIAGTQQSTEISSSTEQSSTESSTSMGTVSSDSSGSTIMTGTSKTDSTENSTTEATMSTATETGDMTGQSSTLSMTTTEYVPTHSSVQSTAEPTMSTRNELSTTGSLMSTTQQSAENSTVMVMTTDSNNGTGAPTGLSSTQIAIIGGVVGGVAFLVFVIVLALIFCKNGDTVVVLEDGNEQTKRKKNEGSSKKNRKSILSWRHRIPLFSTPFDQTVDDDGGQHNPALEGNTDSIIMTYRPKSEIASQIRVNLEADNDEEGTIENGFVPAFISGEDENDYGNGGVVEGRFGIMGPGTFTPAPESNANTAVDREETSKVKDDKADDEEESSDVDELYSRTITKNIPGNVAFDNALYSPFISSDSGAPSPSASDSVPTSTDPTVPTPSDTPETVPTPSNASEIVHTLSDQSESVAKPDASDAAANATTDGAATESTKIPADHRDAENADNDSPEDNA